MSTKIEFSKLTLMDALDLASLIELEALKRYTQFAERLGGGLGDDAASVFQSMAVNEGKHGEQIAERRVALFGDKRPNVTLDDIFDVEAPEVGAPRWDMSPLKAYQVALSSEKKAFAILRPGAALREPAGREGPVRGAAAEEVEHVQMIEAIIDKLPPSAYDDLEDEDAGALPCSEDRKSRSPY